MVKNIASLKRQLSGELDHYFLVQGFDEEELNSLYRIVAKDNGEFIDVYIYAEIDVSDFYSINDSLNDIVITFDPSSYFDIVGPQIYMARIYKSDFEKTDKSDVITQKTLIKFGNLLASKLEDEYDEDFWVEDIFYDEKSDNLTLIVFSTSYESEASIKVFEEDVNSYDQFIKLYRDIALKALKYNIKNSNKYIKYSRKRINFLEYFICIIHIKLYLKLFK